MEVQPSFFRGRDIVQTTPTIVFFYMTGCGHCEDVKPEWQKFVRDSPVATVAFNMTKGDANFKRLFANFVHGVPCFWLYLEGKPYIMFKGDRTYEGLMKFANYKANLNLEHVGR
jgi:hypothetical protein